MSNLFYCGLLTDSFHSSVKGWSRCSRGPRGSPRCGCRGVPVRLRNGRPAGDLGVFLRNWSFVATFLKPTSVNRTFLALSCQVVSEGRGQAVLVLAPGKLPAEGAPFAHLWGPVAPRSHVRSVSAVPRPGCTLPASYLPRSSLCCSSSTRDRWGPGRSMTGTVPSVDAFGIPSVSTDSDTVGEGVGDGSAAHVAILTLAPLHPAEPLQH